jgi:hypothetical protein
MWDMQVKLDILRQAKKFLMSPLLEEGEKTTFICEAIEYARGYLFSYNNLEADEAFLTLKKWVQNRIHPYTTVAKFLEEQNKNVSWDYQRIQAYRHKLLNELFELVEKGEI